MKRDGSRPNPQPSPHSEGAGDGISLDRQAEEFLFHLATDRAVSPYTVRNYRQALVEFVRWYQDRQGDTPDWPRLERDDFRAYLRYLGRQKLGRATISLRFSALRTFYRRLRDRGVVRESPVRRLTLPKQPKRLPVFSTLEQVEQLLKAPMKEWKKLRDANASDVKETDCLRDAAILEVLYSCGLRISELCGLEADDIDWAEQVLQVRGKGKKERVSPIGAPALEAIRLYWAKLPAPPIGKMPVFRTRAEAESKPVYPRLVQMRLKRYLEAAGLDPALTPHKFRHSFATHLLDAGANLRNVQELLGHARLTSTEVYTRVATERLKREYDKAHPRA